MAEEKEIIMFLGLKGCGKDYRAKEYIDKGYKKVAFADALRNGLYETVGYKPTNEKEYSNFKKNSFKYQTAPFKNYSVTGRQLLQNFGTVIKKITNDEKFWNKIVINNILDNELDKVVITDVRFTYEIEDLQKLIDFGYNVKFIWCCYEGADFKKILMDSHESEALNRYIYYHMDKYRLKDGSEILERNMKYIIEGFKFHNMFFGKV